MFFKLENKNIIENLDIERANNKFLEDIDLIMRAADEENAKTIASNEDDGFYDDLKNLINLDDLKTDGAAEYTFDELLEVPELGLFYVD